MHSRCSAVRACGLSAHWISSLRQFGHFGVVRSFDHGLRLFQSRPSRIAIRSRAAWRQRALARRAHATEPHDLIAVRGRTHTGFDFVESVQSLVQGGTGSIVAMPRHLMWFRRRVKRLRCHRSNSQTKIRMTSFTGHHKPGTSDRRDREQPGSGASLLVTRPGSRECKNANADIAPGKHRLRASVTSAPPVSAANTIKA